MGRAAIDDIQRALNTIRAQADEADWRIRLEVLQLMLTASESIVANAKKLTEPKQKVVRQTVTVPKRPKTQQKQPNAQQQTALPTNPLAPQTEPQKPVPPLQNQQISS